MLTDFATSPAVKPGVSTWAAFESGRWTSRTSEVALAFDICRGMICAVVEGGRVAGGCMDVDADADDDSGGATSGRLVASEVTRRAARLSILLSSRFFFLLTLTTGSSPVAPGFGGYGIASRRLASSCNEVLLGSGSAGEGI